MDVSCKTRYLVTALGVTGVFPVTVFGLITEANVSPTPADCRSSSRHHKSGLFRPLVRKTIFSDSLEMLIKVPTTGFV